jgi:hypothetical protein
MGGVSTQDPYDRWATDAQLLAEIGRALSV